MCSIFATVLLRQCIVRELVCYPVHAVVEGTGKTDRIVSTSVLLMRHRFRFLNAQPATTEIGSLHGQFGNR